MLKLCRDTRHIFRASFAYFQDTAEAYELRICRCPMPQRDLTQTWHAALLPSNHSPDMNAAGTARSLATRTFKIRANLSDRAEGKFRDAFRSLSEANKRTAKPGVFSGSDKRDTRCRITLLEEPVARPWRAKTGGRSDRKSAARTAIYTRSSCHRTGGSHNLVRTGVQRRPKHRCCVSQPENRGVQLTKPGGQLYDEVCTSFRRLG